MEKRWEPGRIFSFVSFQCFILGFKDKKEVTSFYFYFFNDIPVNGIAIEFRIERRIRKKTLKRLKMLNKGR